MQMKIYCFNENSADAVSNYNKMGIVNIDLTKIFLDDNFHEEDPNTINLQELLILLFYYLQRT